MNAVPLETLFLLYLAHFLGDYPFQTNWVFAHKIKNCWRGGLLHTFGIFLALLLTLAPFLDATPIWYVIGIVTVVHYFQDAIKVSIDTQHHHYKKLSYIGDQVLHLSLLTFLWVFFLKGTELSPAFGTGFFSNEFIILFCLGLVLVTFFLDVTIGVFKHKIVEDLLSFGKPFQRNHKFMLKNAIIYSILWAIGAWIFNITAITF